MVVTFNYRLGPFGFFAHPELAKESGRNASGNYGVMDAIAVMQWVKKNISAFGGDPNNVTLFGESAGSIMIGALVGSPQAKGLFHRAINQSGTWMGVVANRMASGTQAMTNGAAAVEKMGVKSIAELRARPVAELAGVPTAGLIVDGYLFPEDLSLTFANGKQNAVDVLVGSNKDEATFGICPAVTTDGGVQGTGAEDAWRSRGRLPGALSRECRRGGGGHRHHRLRRQRQLERAAVRRRAGEEGEEGLRLLLHARTDHGGRFPVAARRDAHGRDLLRLQQSEGAGEPELE